MTRKDITGTNFVPADAGPPINIIRHAEVRQKLNVSSAKLYDMVAKGIFIKPFVIIPGGRAVGWLEADVDSWIVGRSADRREGSHAPSRN